MHAATNQLVPRIAALGCRHSSTSLSLNSSSLAVLLSISDLASLNLRCSVVRTCRSRELGRSPWSTVVVEGF
eukprot:COSAG01_NODE_28468_length_660_cov_1.247772_1_plen_71_part_10